MLRVIFRKISPRPHAVFPEGHKILCGPVVQLPGVRFLAGQVDTERGNAPSAVRMDKAGRSRQPLGNRLVRANHAGDKQHAIAAIERLFPLSLPNKRHMNALRKWVSVSNAASTDTDMNPGHAGFLLQT